MPILFLGRNLIFLFFYFENDELPLQLKETAERILAVDRAAAMVEEMLKQSQNSLAGFPTSQAAASNGVKVYMHCITESMSY